MFEVKQETVGKYAVGDGLCVKFCFVGCKIAFCPTKSPAVSPSW